jgi:glycosyltransferase involved in cell wall biosynthesis
MFTVSVIIPVYNCEKYIEKCLESVQNQTCEGLEIVCIDDGSTDKSVDIIKAKQKSDGRIRLFQQSNHGAGLARNLGIQKAGGRYLAFLDADDYYVDADALRRMTELCDDLHVEVCGSLRKRLDCGITKTDCMFRGDVYREPQILKYTDFQMDYDYQSFIFSRQLLQKNNIVFPDYRWFEDPVFMVRAMHAAGEFAVVQAYLYCYRVPDMAAKINAVKACDLLRGLRDNLRFSSEKGLDVLFAKSLGRLEYEYANIIFNNVSDNDLEMLELLLDINSVVRERLNDATYIVRPLRKILGSVVQENKKYEENLVEWISHQENVVLYGAGKYAKSFLLYLEEKNLKNRVSAIIVSKLANNLDSIENVRVLSIEDFAVSEMKKQQVNILVTVGGAYQGEIEKILLANDIERYILLDDVFLNRLDRQRRFRGEQNDR